MFVANTGSMAMLFNEEGINSSGSLTKSIRRPNEMTARRAKAVGTIVKISNDKGEPIGVTVRKVLSQSIPELQSFVQARAEAPATNPVSLAVQAALLRATEIGLVSKTIDTDDDDALLIIEDSEQQHVDDNTMDSSGILSPDTAAGLALLVQRISERYKELGGSGKLQDFVQAMKDSTGINDVSCCQVANNATGDDDYYNYYKDLLSTGGGTTTTTSTTTSTKSSFWDNLFSAVDKVVDNLIGKGSGAIDQIIKNAGGSVKDTVDDIGGGIGSASIAQYMQKNGLTIILVIVALIVLTIIITRVSRK